MRLAVFKGFFNGTDRAFLAKPLISLVAVVSRFRVKLVGKFPIVSDESVIFVLNRDDARYKIEQHLVFINAFVQF